MLNIKKTYIHFALLGSIFFLSTGVYSGSSEDTEHSRIKSLRKLTAESLITTMYKEAKNSKYQTINKIGDLFLNFGNHIEEKAKLQNLIYDPISKPRWPLNVKFICS